MVIVEFYKRFYNQGITPHLYFWRDHTGHEVDLLIDKGNSTYPIEIKAARTISHAFFNNTTYLAEIADLNPKDNLLIYAGDEHQKRSVGQVVSWKNIDTVEM